MSDGNQILATVRRYILDLEERVEKQKALIERLAASGRDSTQAKQTLRALATTLALTREHLELQTIIETRRNSLAPAADQTG
ncbi:hypothetical protein [Dongia deserti]|uniref:hypothetical protein n=1 Tax=Dongia deserti TaxID=2268030 RepID=UPI000E65CC17|nr:hypothetical protein [Dongia deserti]